jgi:hypothetical protein
MFPVDRSWLVSTLWDDDWICVGGSRALVDAARHHPDLGRRTRQVAPSGEDATPPGHVPRNRKPFRSYAERQLGVGQTVAAGQTVATFAPSRMGIEIGWWAPSPGRPRSDGRLHRRAWHARRRGLPVPARAAWSEPGMALGVRFSQRLQRLGCGSPGVTLCRLGDDAEGVAGSVDAAAFLGQVEVPVLIEVVVGDEGAELEDGFG